MNAAGALTGTITLPDFFGGQAQSDWSIDARDLPRWHIQPTLTDIDSQALLAWSGTQHEWVALLAGTSDIAMTGNTRRELATSLESRTQFDAGTGRLDVRDLRDLALSIAKRAGGTERIERWPEVLDYSRFTGTWNIAGATHQATLLLDNLSLALAGTVDPLTDAIDVAMTVTVLAEPEFKASTSIRCCWGWGCPSAAPATSITPSARPTKKAPANWSRRRCLVKTPN
ncbi:MAG: hypothetical protein HC809_11110 [Gammaproteobacteria bacterium]|nr:hypothetical protein [Gammaproteobacteria bacterium]